MNRKTARMCLRSGYPLRVRVNASSIVTVQADIFSGNIYASLSVGATRTPRTRMNAIEAIRFLKTNYSHLD
jgi:hypothetical protein